jgi:hypothetical protein
MILSDNKTKIDLLNKWGDRQTIVTLLREKPEHPVSMKSHFSMEVTPHKELCWETAEYDKSPPPNYYELDRCNVISEVTRPELVPTKNVTSKEKFFSVPLRQENCPN